MRAVTDFERADGTTSYRVKFRHGTSRKTGKRGYTSETFTKRRDAERFARLLDDLGPQGALDQLYAEDQAPDVPLLDDYAAEHIKHLTRITAGTRITYERIYKRTWSTPLGYLPLHHITRQRISEVVNELSAGGAADKTIANAHGLLAGIMNGAVLDGHLATSPCKGVRLPRNTEHLRKENVFLTREEYQLLRSMMVEHFRPLLDMLAGTGMRWGEAEALEVRSINFRAKTVVITRSAKWNASKSTREFGPPKTKRGRRTITLPDSLVTVLQDQVAGKDKNDLVFTMPKGGQLRHATFHHRYWVPACDELGLDPAPRLHDLRHSHVAWLISAGVPLAVIQARLGHESIKTTVDVYGHLLPETQVAAAEAANLVFMPAPVVKQIDSGTPVSSS